MRHDDSKYAEFKVSDLFDVKYGVNLELNERDWKEFKVKELFNVELSKGDIKFDEMDSGDVPLVSSGETNNGIVGYIDSRGDGKAEIFPSNRITLDMFGNAFYQDEPFYAVSHGRVNILNPKFELTRNIGLFISAVIKQEQYKYSYGRAIYSGVAENMVIKLPVMADGDPDWQFMEDYIKSLHHKPLTTKNKAGQAPELNVRDWKRFSLGRLFDIRKGKRLTSDDQEEGDNLYIGAIDSNNGVANHIEQPPIHDGNTISLSYNGSVGEAFYQPEPYWATDDVNALYPKFEGFNAFIGLFMAATIRQEKYRFSYGRKWTLDNMKITDIGLPIQHNSDGTPMIDCTRKWSDDGYVPDWQFMENYMKSLPYGDRLEG